MKPDFVFSPYLAQSHDSTQHAIKKAWETFITNQEITPIVPPLIAASWRRCWGKVNPLSPLKFTHVDNACLLASQTASFDLMAIARPVLEDIYQCVQGSETALILTNNAGCILDMIGDSLLQEYVTGSGIAPGCMLSEELIGTNSFSLALTERMPVQVAGCEHFVQQLHRLTGAAAAIFDVSGHLLGVFGLIMPAEKYHIHSLGLVTAAARYIESQRQSDVLLAEQNNRAGAIECHPFGDFGWDYGLERRGDAGTCQRGCQPDSQEFLFNRCWGIPFKAYYPCRSSSAKHTCQT